MDDDWDLYAVVRGCAATLKAARITKPAAAASSAAAAAATTNNPLPSFPSDLPIYGEQNSFGFPALGDGRNNPYQGLQEIYYDFCYGNPAPTPTAAASIMPVDPAFVLQPRQDFMQIKPPLQLNMPIQENVQFISPPIGSPPQNLPAATIPQPTRTRRRKNHQPKLVRQMTKDELSTDSWAWRKYGQKPIKGSPHPRNYYRCSTSKGCAARKQVERSSDVPETFVVTYSGEHTHPRPTHRSSLAGSTRTRFASPAAAKNGSTTNVPQKGLMASAPSTAAGSSFSPDTPSVEAEAAALINDLPMAEVYEGSAEDEENIIMLANDFMNDDGDDDIFRGFQDSDDLSSGGGGDFFSSGFLASPPWTPSSSGGGNAAPFNGNGGC